jgi:hypothetical protein
MKRKLTSLLIVALLVGCATTRTTTITSDGKNIVEESKFDSVGAGAFFGTLFGAVSKSNNPKSVTRRVKPTPVPATPTPTPVK